MSEPNPTNTQPAETPQMNAFDDVTGAYDEYLADVFSIGKTAYEVKGKFPKKTGTWTNSYYGIDNPGICCLSSTFFL